MSRGFFTIAQGKEYQRMAYALALSLKLSQQDVSTLSIGVTSDEIKKVNPKHRAVFDQVVEIPWGDHAKKSSWKLENEWKVIHMTPYDETIKLDADMLFPASIDGWWQLLDDQDYAFATSAMTYRGEVITSDFYRKTFTESELPNVYTAMFYFKKTEASFELFKLAELIFNNWERFFYEFLKPDHRPKLVSTDVVFALAAKILDYRPNDVLASSGLPTFVHMKSQLQGWPNNHFMNEDWTKVTGSSFNLDGTLKVGNFRQSLPFHYHVKSFLTDKMISKMEKRLGI